MIRNSYNSKEAYVNMGQNVSFLILKRIVSSFKHLEDVQLQKIVKTFMWFMENKLIVTGGPVDRVLMHISQYVIKDYMCQRSLRL